MAHVFALSEGRSVWHELMLWDLRHRVYPFIAKDGRVNNVQLNPRELKLFDFTLPEQCIPMLLDDLAPFADEKSYLQQKAHYITKALRFITGLHPIQYDPVPSYQVRKQWINIVPIGWKVDKEDTAHPHRGELL